MARAKYESTKTRYWGIWDLANPIKTPFRLETGPDLWGRIQYSTVSEPTPTVQYPVKRIARYIRGTRSEGLWLRVHPVTIMVEGFQKGVVGPNLEVYDWYPSPGRGRDVSTAWRFAKSLSLSDLDRLQRSLAWYRDVSTSDRELMSETEHISLDSEIGSVIFTKL